MAYPTDSTPNYPGKADLSAYLRVFGGEVVAEYNKRTVVKDTLRQRNITSGRSCQFPTISTEAAKLHTPGQDLFSSGYDSDMSNDEKVIQINKLLIAKAFVDYLDEAMQHYNSRAEYAAQMGAALATACDRWSIGALVKGSDSTRNHASAAVGALTTQQKLDEIQVAAGLFDNRGVPTENRYMLVTPTDYYNFMGMDGVVSSDFGTGGDRNKPGELHFMGFKILKSAIWDEFDQNATITADAADPLKDLDGRSTYETDLTKVWGLAYHGDAAGWVNLRGMTTEASYEASRQGTLLVAKQAAGAGILRPQSCIKMAGA